MTEQQVLLEIDGAVATITLNRPDKLNALTPEMLATLEGYCQRLEQDDSVRVVILQGAGRAFCVGADIIAWTALEPLQMWRQWIRDGHRVFDRVARLRQPVIASIHGYAFGGGLELAMAADLRIMADDATVAQPEVKLATVPGWGGTQRLATLIGPSRAKRMIFTGERVDAATAQRWGLVDVVPSEELAEHTREVADSIAANAPVSVQLAKQIVDGGSLALEGLAGALSATTEDAKEGLASFQERRPPQFKGR